jgi:GNAT superfamily N-acetyltransferase
LDVSEEVMDVAPAWVLRTATPADVAAIFGLIQALADYENLSDQVTGTPEALRSHLFGDRTYAEVVLAEWDGQPVGMALFFTNYSTFLTQPGIYLEDLYVLPDFRGRGIGRGLLRHVAGIALARNYGRFEWAVLDWNEPAIAFYRQMGADVLPDWRICRVTGEALRSLAAAETQNPLAQNPLAQNPLAQNPLA